jgi:hypothetical protein
MKVRLIELVQTASVPAPGSSRLGCRSLMFLRSRSRKAATVWTMLMRVRPGSEASLAEAKATAPAPSLLRRRCDGQTLLRLRVAVAFDQPVDAVTIQGGDGRGVEHLLALE